ncbi:MAG: PAS domain S-box protein [Dehalococcoidales bacterium]|nr:PAS domain S-box protein [Dehalococcoidales bacterium]
MKLGTRIIIVIISTTLCLCAVLFVTLNWALNHNYEQLENNQMKEDLKRIQYAIENEEISVSNMSASWAAWDETYQFAENGNQDYIDNNFSDDTFIIEDINVYAIINTSGEPVYIGSYDIEDNRRLVVSEQTREVLTDTYLLARDEEKGKIGIVRTGEGPLLIGTNPILTSKGQGPLRGTLITGRYLDRRLLAKISYITKLEITIESLEEFAAAGQAGIMPPLSPDHTVYIQPLDSDTLAGYSLLTDIHGRPYLVIGTQTARDIFSQGRVTFTWLYASIAVVAVLIILVNLHFLYSMVLQRLRILGRFASRISRSGDFSERVSLKGQDELKDLGDHINAMIDRLSKANEQVLESENKYSTLVENSSDGIIIISNSLITYANNRVLQLLGMSREELIGSRSDSTVAPPYRDIVNSRYRNRIKGLPAEESYEIEIITKNGANIPVEISAGLIKLNQQVCVMIVMRDISERKKAEKVQEELLLKEKAIRQNLEEEARTRSQFINVLAHELRTPLTPILASLEMARDSLSSNPGYVQYKLVKNALDGAVTLRERLEELLDLARFSRGVFTLTPKEIETGEFIKAVIQRFAPTLKEKNQHLTLDLPGSLPAMTADPSRLEQVIVNLLSNAGKYSPEDSEITVRASAVPEGIMVEVVDQGEGILREDVEKIFTPYYRVSQTSQKVTGIGLGLAVCKQIIEAHKGRIWVESEPGQGSTFRFIVPLNFQPSGETTPQTD